MRKICLCCLVSLLTACASDPPQIPAPDEPASISGTRVDRSKIAGDSVIVLEPHNSGAAGLTVGELLDQMNHDSFGFPGKSDYSSCDDLLLKLRNIDTISIVDVSADAVVARSDRATMTYKFPNGGCDPD